MKHHEFYTKYKTSYPPIINPIFSKRNWWHIVIITVGAVLIGPLVMYKHQRSAPLSFNYYIRLIEYSLYIIIPLVGVLIWSNWRESTKRSKGYSWIGKFEVINKQSSIAFCYLFLAPGNSNKIKVNRALFEKVRVGDLVKVRRDALGNIEEISKVSKFSSRLARVASRRVQKPAETYSGHRVRSI